MPNLKSLAKSRRCGPAEEDWDRGPTRVTDVVRGRELVAVGIGGKAQMGRLTIVALAVMGLASIAPVATAQTAPPNIVVILADDMRTSWMTCRSCSRNLSPKDARSPRGSSSIRCAALRGRRSFAGSPRTRRASTTSMANGVGGLSSSRADVEDEMLNVWLDPACQMLVSLPGDGAPHLISHLRTMPSPPG